MKEHIAAPTEILTGVTGTYINPLELLPEQVDIRDIAHHLGNQCRYSGAVREFYSVAEHSVRCYRYVLQKYPDEPSLHRQTLLHDSAEYALQDMARPLKEDPRFGQAYRGAEKRAEKVIFPVLDVEYPFDDRVWEADLVLLATERRDLLPQNGRWTILDGIEPLREKIVPWSPKRARSTFLAEYEGLAG